MFKHNHTNKNNLDTKPIFREFFKYVENSYVLVVYYLDKYFKIASNSEELLSGDDMERILLVIETNIPAEANDFQNATVSKMQDINPESCFMPKFQKSI